MTIAGAIDMIISLLDILASKTKTGLDDKALKYLRVARKNLVKARAQKLSKKKLFAWERTPRW